jgi:hypothetical protein
MLIVKSSKYDKITMEDFSFSFCSERLFMCLVALCISSLQKSLLNPFVTFKNEVVLVIVELWELFCLVGQCLNTRFLLVQKALYHMSHTSSPFCSSYFGDGVSWTIGPSWPIHAALLISASQVARITHVSRLCRSRVLNVFLTLTDQIYDLQIFSSIPWVCFSLWWMYLLMCLSFPV